MELAGSTVWPIQWPGYRMAQLGAIGGRMIVYVDATDGVVAIVRVYRAPEGAHDGCS